MVACLMEKDRSASHVAAAASVVNTATPRTPRSVEFFQFISGLLAPRAMSRATRGDYGSSGGVVNRAEDARSWLAGPKDRPCGHRFCRARPLGRTSRSG